VERVLQQRGRLRLLRELAMEACARRELERERVRGEVGRLRLAQDRRGRDRPLLDRRDDRSLPRFLELLQLDGRRTCGRWRRGRGRRGRLRLRLRADGDGPLLELLEPEGDRLAREVG